MRIQKSVSINLTVKKYIRLCFSTQPSGLRQIEKQGKKLRNRILAANFSLIEYSEKIKWLLNRKEVKSIAFFSATSCMLVMILNNHLPEVRKPNMDANKD